MPISPDIPGDIKEAISLAAGVEFPGVIIDWSESDAALVVPISLKPQIKKISTFISGYAYKLGVTIDFPSVDSMESSITYPTR